MAKPLDAEHTYWLNQINAGTSEYIVGVDECGYGSWAGPVTVCAAVVQRGWSHPRVKDSKKVGKVHHEELVRAVLVPPAVPFYSVVSESNRVIDKIGLLPARDKAIAVAIRACLERYPAAMVVMDGNVRPVGAPRCTICLPKADKYIPAVSAASLLAKEEHDWFMRSVHAEYSGYGFNTNAGYGTEEHEAGLAAMGATPYHRLSIERVRKYKRADVLDIRRSNG